MENANNDLAELSRSFDLLSRYADVLNLDEPTRGFARKSLELFPVAGVKLSQYGADNAAVACLYHALSINKPKSDKNPFAMITPKSLNELDAMFHHVEAVRASKDLIYP